MLMTSYSQRSLFKWACALLILLMICAMAAIFIFQVDRWLPRYALPFTDVIAQRSQTKISFSMVHYRFPDHIIFKNVTVFEADKKAPILQASRVTVGLFNTIVINDMAIHFPAFKDYWARHGEKVHAWAAALPQKNMRLVVPNGRFYLTDDGKGDPVAFKIDLRLDQDRLNAHGSWGDKHPFNYALYVHAHDHGFDLDKFTLTDTGSSMNLWGSWHGDTIDWKGFIFYEKFYILDIDGNLKVQQNAVALKQLSFNINGDPVKVRGYCSPKNIFQCDADIALKNIRLHLHSQNTPQGLALKGGADLNGTHVDFEDLTGQVVNNNFLKLRTKRIQAIFPVQGREHKVFIDDLWASIDFARPYQKIIALSARMYGGNFHSRIRLETSSLPWQLKGQGQFEGIDIGLLSSSFSSLKQCHGHLYGNFDLQAPKNTEFTGALTLHNGDFDNTDFQVWAAKTLQMPSLDHLSNAEMSCRFKVDEKSKTLEDLRLNTDEFNLRGFFDLDADDLVSSQDSVRFSKKTLSESPIGRQIIGLVRGAWTLPFEFRLSGNIYRMNFQWDNSPLKDKVRQHLFSFFERMIDQRMDAHPVYRVTIPSESVSPG